MIGFLSGEVFEIFENGIILLVNGVGYKVFPTNSYLERAKRGDSTNLHIVSIIKEDVFDLYGFETHEEKNLFELIIGISGIGPKTAIGILSKGKINDIIDAISRGDASYFSGIPRLGKKNAQKLIIELKSKAGSLDNLSFIENKEREDILEALKGFGYQEREIMIIMPEIEKNGEKIEQKISYALKYLGKK